MKKIAQSVGLALLIATLGTNALADGPRGYYRQPHREYSHLGGDAGWVAPLLFLGLAGAIIGAANSQPSPPPPVYVSPPVTYAPPIATYVAPVEVAPAPSMPPPPPADAWYFCRSVGQYYPYTQYCPEGWQLVPPTR